MWGLVCPAENVSCRNRFHSELWPKRGKTLGSAKPPPLMLPCLFTSVLCAVLCDDDMTIQFKHFFLDSAGARTFQAACRPFIVERES